MAPVPLLLFVVVMGLDLGAGVYEARIVVPLWANGVPETLAAGNPYGRVAIDAGVRFWAYMTSAVAFSAILALGSGFQMPAPQRAWQMFAALAELAVVATTLLYFRPTLVRLFMDHGAGLSAGAVTSTVRRWVRWSSVRVAVSFVAWCSAVYALTLR